MRGIVPSLPFRPALCAALGMTLAAGTLAGTPAFAQDKTPAAQDEKASREMLNTDQGERARQQLEANEASQKAHDDAVQRLEMDEKMYGGLRREYPELQRRYEEALSAWKEAVAACESGDMLHCPTANPPQD